MFSLCINSLPINNFHSFLWLITSNHWTLIVHFVNKQIDGTTSHTGFHRIPQTSAGWQEGLRACSAKCMMLWWKVSVVWAPTSSGLIVALLPHQCLSSDQMPRYLVVTSSLSPLHIMVISPTNTRQRVGRSNKYTVGDNSFHQQAPAAGGEQGTLDFTNKCPVEDTSFHQQISGGRHFISPTSSSR